MIFKGLALLYTLLSLSLEMSYWSKIVTLGKEDWQLMWSLSGLATESCLRTACQSLGQKVFYWLRIRVMHHSAPRVIHNSLDNIEETDLDEINTLGSVRGSRQIHLDKWWGGGLWNHTLEIERSVNMKENGMMKVIHWGSCWKIKFKNDCRTKNIENKFYRYMYRKV